MMNVENELIKANPRIQKILIKIFANSVLAYIEACKNVAENGSICVHPRTGAPIENPYLKVAEKHGAILARMSKQNKIKSDNILKMFDEFNLEKK